MDEKRDNKRNNKTMLQAFTWFMPDDGSLWNRIAEMAPDLKDAGINMVWLPPAYKADRTYNSAGYDVYDRYDLGEYPQKGTTRTRYGTKEQYLDCIKALHRNRMSAIADIVLNQMCGADDCEPVEAVTYHQNDRKNPIYGGTSKTIMAYTKFNFSGREKVEEERATKNHTTPKPVERWDWHDFNSVDYDKNNHDYDSRSDLGPDKKNVYRFTEKKFSDDVSHEFNNYDYLLGCNIDYQNPATCDKVIRWGEWYLKETKVDGFRLDAVKHISKSFMATWIRAMQKEYKKTHKKRQLFVVGEYLKGELDAMLDYPDSEEAKEDLCRLFDFPLQAKLHNKDARVFSGSLAADQPELAVTLVNNHDMDPYQGYGGVRIVDNGEEWSLREKSYAWILFQEKALPCVYLGDLMGYKYPLGDELGQGKPYHEYTGYSSRLNSLLKLCLLRHEVAYGKQYSIEEGDVRGYVRIGLPSLSDTGMVILLTNGNGNTVKRVRVSRRCGCKMVNIFSPNGGADHVDLDENGYGDFTVIGNGLGVWITEEAYNRLKDHPAFRNGYDWLS